MCARNFLKAMRCKWDVLWHHKASVCWTCSVRVAGVCHRLHLSPSGEQNDIQKEVQGKKKLKRFKRAHIFHRCSILYHNKVPFLFLPTGGDFLHGDSTPSGLHWKVLMCDVKRSASHLGKGGVWYSRVTAQPREKWKCSVSVRACFSAVENGW